MAFRADEAARVGYEEVEAYLIPRPRNSDESKWDQSKHALRNIVAELGPVVRTYPTWHPLVCNHDEHDPVTTPSERCGYKGLDHTRYFVNGFVTCPYDDGQSVIDSVAALPCHSDAVVVAERLDVNFYNTQATAILVKCKWNKPLPADGMIPSSIVVPLILEKEMPNRQWSKFAETWDSMRPYFLGSPHGSRSSLFVNQETGQTIKRIWESLIHTGMFGPIYVK